jgi:hypothetical protein
VPPLIFKDYESMRIRLTTDLSDGIEHGCVVGKEFDAVLIRPRSTTVEFVSDAGRRVRAFYYEYETVETVEES